MTKTGKLSHYFIFGLLAFVAAIAFIRTYYHEASGDELLYQYVWEKDDPTNLWEAGHRFEKKISSFSDILQTQILHYKLVNGRSIVHSIEQAFTNHELLFSIVNTMVFILFVSLIMVFSTRGTNNRNNYLLWLIAILSLILLFPYQQSLWISVNYGLNYLWPATLTVLILILWDKIETESLPSKWNIPMVLIALLFGWTHEGFVVGVAGGLFFYYCFNFKKFRGQALMLCIPLWLSATVMVFSPGNLSRFFGSGGGSLFIKLANGIDNVVHLWVFMIMMIGIICLLLSGRKQRIKEFVKNNSRIFLVLVIGFVFSLIANTAPYSHALVELLSLIIIIRYLSGLKLTVNRLYVTASVLLTLLFVGQQVVLASDNIKVYKETRDFLENYKNSDYNAYLYRPVEISSTSVPYIRLLNGERGFFLKTYDAVYFNRSKPVYLLSEDDYKAVAAPSEFFTEKNRFSANAPVYKAEDGEYIWIKADSLDSNKKFVADLYPVDWNHEGGILVKMKFALFPASYPAQEELSIDTVRTQYGTSYRIHTPPVRKIRTINYIER